MYCPLQCTPFCHTTISFLSPCSRFGLRSRGDIKAKPLLLHRDALSSPPWQNSRLFTSARFEIFFSFFSLAINARKSEYKPFHAEARRFANGITVSSKKKNCKLPISTLLSEITLVLGAPRLPSCARRILHPNPSATL